MDEYISKSYLIMKFNELADKYAGNEHKRQRALAYATAADLIKSIPATDVQPADRWIDAQKNPPRIVDRRSMTSESVLILRDNGRCAVAYYCYDAEEGNYWTTDDDKTMYEWGEVTYWQPLPGPPKEDGGTDEDKR